MWHRRSRSQHAEPDDEADSWQEYRPFPWLTNGHVETIWAALFRRGANVKYYRRCLSMPDGGVVSIDYEYPQKVLGSRNHPLHVTSLSRRILLGLCQAAWS